MLQLQTDLEGKMVHFNNLRNRIQCLGYSIDGNWDYHKGSFDNVLCREAEENIYLRLPFEVLEGDLNHHEMYIKFQTPYVTTPSANVALNKIEDKNRWKYAGEQAVEQIVRLVQ